MNRYEFNGNLRKGRTSAPARLAYQDMLKDECTTVLVDINGTIMKRHIVITEEMLGIELKNY